MSSHKGSLTIDRGAESSVFAALLPPQTQVRGDFIWHDCQVLDWVMDLCQPSSDLKVKIYTHIAYVLEIPLQ